MDTQFPGSPTSEFHKQPDSISVSKLFTLFVDNWYYILGTLLVAIICAFLYNRYTLPTYRVTSTVLIEEGESRRIPGAESMLQGYGLQPGVQNLDNQIQILSSWSMIERALGELDFKYDCYRMGLIRQVSYYPERPVNIDLEHTVDAPYNEVFSITVEGDNKFKIAKKQHVFMKKDTIVTAWKKFDFMEGEFTIKPSLKYLSSQNRKEKIYFIFLTKESLAAHYRARLRVEQASRDGSIVSLSLEGTNKVKDKIFLDKLVEVFLASNLEKKNHEAKRIIEFIDEQLVNVTDSLMITENKLQEFRSRNRIMDVSAQAQQIIDQALVYENEKARLTLESNYYEYLTEYLSKENNQEIPISPATMGITDPLLAQLMQDLSGLQAEYFSSGVGEMNPLQSQLELRINNTKQSLRETLQGIIRANRMAMEENSEQIRLLNVTAASLPVKERQLLGIEREFNLNNELYNFLLQQRAEAQIQKASNKADNQLIDQARAAFRPISPNKRMIYLFAIVLGFFAPLVILLLADSLNNKINTEKDLKSLTKLPIIGHIPHSKLNYQTVVLNDPQAPVAEAFRTLRNRLHFFIKETESPVILVSSSIPGEGKSFISLNLASAYSLTGKKTVLIGFDLRRPKLALDFEIDKSKGVSTYLIGQHKLNDIIQKTHFDNLDIIPAGPIPPNPGELTDSDKTRELFQNLKKKYSYIIVDSAPIGTVSDGYPLASIADTTILMIRNGKSLKRPLETTLSELSDIGISGLSILVNDFKTNKGSYRYAYKYKYDTKLKHMQT